MCEKRAWALLSSSVKLGARVGLACLLFLPLMFLLPREGRASVAQHSCIVTTTGGAKCWGNNSNGQLGDNSTTQKNSPVDVSGLTSGVAGVATGGFHSCALTTGGGVKCWGYNFYGQLGDSSTTQRTVPVDVTGLTSGVAQITAGFYHTCALLNTGGVKCWGLNDNGRLGDASTTQRPAPVDVFGLSSGIAQVSAGGSHTCALTIGSGVKCWGKNSNGQLGDSSLAQKLTPTNVTNLTSGAVQIAAGDEHTCAVSSAGGAKCWGDNLRGQVGDGGSNDRSFPSNVSGLTSGVVQIVSGNFHACALTGTGGVKCWGEASFGQLGNDAFAVRQPTPVDVVSLSDAVQLSAGHSHACALVGGGALKCWGSNFYGQLGDGTTSQKTAPVDVSGMTSGVANMTAGLDFTCAVASGGLKCWGLNSDGQLGDNTTNYHGSPNDVSGLTSGVAQSAAGEAHACAVTTGGGVKCWGLNNAGQVGDGTNTPRLVPVDVSGLTSGVASVASKQWHTCAVTTGGGAKCWGYNFSGQLGDGSSNHSNVPVDVFSLSSGVAKMVTGWHHSCALTTGGGVKCWGLNSNGQLGDGTTGQHIIPGDVTGLTGGVTQIASGALHTCALTTAGGVKCWGFNSFGQIGDNTTSLRTLPTDVTGLTSGVAQITAGYWHTCAVTTGGAVKCWGLNDNGQVGDGTFTQRNSQVSVSGLSSGIAQVTAGTSHTCAVTTGGAAKCWGDNGHGQLGIVGTGFRPTPISVLASPGGSAIANVSEVWDYTIVTVVPPRRRAQTTSE